MIKLGERAEAYIEHVQSQRAGSATGTAEQRQRIKAGQQREREKMLDDLGFD